MKPENIHYKSLNREGMTLVAFRRVALPIFLLRVRFLLLVSKGMKPIPEFVLRSIDAGQSTVSEVSNLLGIDENVVIDALHELTNLDAVILGVTEGEDSHRLLVTQRGKEILSKMLKVTVQEEQTASIPIDGLTRTYDLIDNKQLVRGSDIEAMGIIELPATPDSQPNLADVEFELRRFYNDTLHRHKNTDRELAEVLSIDRSDRLFRDDAYLLYYRSTQGRVEAGLLVGEQVSDAHEEASHNWPHIRSSAIIPSSINEAIPTLSPVFKLLAGRDKGWQHQFASVNPFRLTRLLRDAVNKAERRLFISSPRLNSAVVTHEFITTIETMLKRDIKIFIAYDRVISVGGVSIDNSEALLNDLSSRFSNMVVIPQNVTNVSVLVCDDKYAVVTNMSLLSYLGESSLPVTDELGYYWEGSEGIERLLKNVLI